jgi:hypothetical protein
VIAAARYLLSEHLRTRGFVAPTVVLLAGVVVLYAQPPNPVLSTAGTVAAFLFAAQCWLALGLFNSQGAADRQVLIATVGGRRFALARLLAAGALAGLTSVLVLALPLVTGRFERTPHLGEIGLVLLANLGSAVAGTALAALFSQPIVRNRAIAVLGLSACALLTLPLDLPPVVPTARALDTTHAGDVPGRLVGDLVSVALFTIAVTVAYSLLWRRRE